jgi:A118 family predicted phage portal protein
MNMAKKGCEDWTTLLFNEKVQITVDNDAINDQVRKVLDDNNFDVEFSNLLEKSFALGTGVMIEFIHNGKVMIDYIIGDMVIISSYRNNDITGICTVNEIQDGKDIITHLTHHDIRDVQVGNEFVSQYIIEHEVFISQRASQLGKTAPITMVFNDQEANNLAVDVDGQTKFMVVYETDTAHFQIIKPNIVNNYDMDNPMGISIFANSIDNLKSMDLKFDSFSNEFELAKHRIMVDATSVTKEITTATQTGTQITRPFDTNDRVFLGMNLKNEDKAINYFNAPIRADEHFTGLNFDVQTYGFSLGFGTDYYAYDARGVYQNIDAVYSELSDLYSNKKKHEIILVKAWTNLVKSILFLLRETGVIAGDIDTLDIVVKPDDSIIINDEAILKQLKEDMSDSLVPEWMYVMARYKISKPDAIALIAEANAGVEETTMPIPNEGEDEETFIARFMADEDMIIEFPDETQRRAIAQETFEKSGS